MKLPQKVKQAHFQAPVTALGIFQGETNVNREKHPSIRMELHDFGLLCIKGDVAAIVPTTNIKVALLDSVVEDEVYNGTDSKTKSK